MATGLQNKFGWAGVAAAGVAAGIGEAAGLTPLGGSTGSLSLGNIASHVAVGAALSRGPPASAASVVLLPD